MPNNPDIITNINTIEKYFFLFFSSSLLLILIKNLAFVSKNIAVDSIMSIKKSIYHSPLSKCYIKVLFI